MTATPTASPVRPAPCNGGLWIGETLVANGTLTRSQLDTALQRYRELQCGTLAEVLEYLAMVTPRQVAELYASRHRLAIIDLTPAIVDRTVARLLPRARAVELVALPFRGTTRAVEIALANPATYTLKDAARDFPGREITLHVAPKKDILAAIDEAHREFVVVENNADYLRELLRKMINERASDIHVELMTNNVRIRKRIDGLLSDHSYLAKDANNSLVQAVKTAARLNISERRLPQDGQFGDEVGSRKYTFRVSTIPCQFGENCVIRIQDEFSNIRSFAELGMFDDDIATLRELLALPYGLLYWTGPTGSGKTTLMYSALATLPTRALKILTAEEPVEYVIPDYSQVTINDRIRNESHALSFRDILRAFLRQDPDVILVGETRDVETAKLAIQAALTGHLVFSTLHTNTATGAISRLLAWRQDGVEPILVASAVRAAIGLRLIRRICTACREPHPQADALRRHYGFLPDATIYAAQPNGCPECKNGYKGRIGIFEIFRFDQAAEQITVGANEHVIRKILIESHGARTLQDDGLRKVAAGLTTIEEVFAHLL
jgi:type II secretory ATPase GspE/PulE/Tfp pilus assembly ATPase PilB-like protein